jgi:hypothetical protein
VQLFQKVPALHILAPTQSEPPFLAAQVVVLLLFIILDVFAALRFRIEPPDAEAPLRGKAIVAVPSVKDHTPTPSLEHA